MQLKTVKVTNIGNVLIHVPAYIVNKWDIKEGDFLNVNYNEKTGHLEVIPATYRGSSSTKASKKFSGSAARH